MFNGMLCPTHRDPVEQIVDNDYRTIIEEHQESTLTNLPALETDYSIIELVTARIRRWLAVIK